MKRSLLRNIFSDDLKMHQKKFSNVQAQVELIEKYIPRLKNRISEYSNKKTEEKKCLDKMITLLGQYAGAENGTLQLSIEDFARILNQMNQHLDDFLIEFDDKVLQDLSEFKTRCKHLRADLKVAVTSAEQENIRQRQLQRLQLLKDQERERISAAEAELLKSKAESTKASRNVQESSDIFEQKKLMGLRATLLAWTNLELRYHARALELFTDAYQAIAAIDVVSDLEDFRSKMQLMEPMPPRLTTVQQTASQYLNSDR